jgi:hypothetical protein
MSALIPPPERDLRRAGTIRRELVAAVATPRRAPRLVPVGVAAGVVLIAGAATAVLTGVGTAPLPITPGSSTTSALLRACLNDDPPPPSLPPPNYQYNPPPPLTGAQVLVDRHDDFGTIALVGRPDKYALCGVDPDGQRMIDSYRWLGDAGLQPGVVTPVPGEPGWQNDTIQLGPYQDFGGIQADRLQTGGPDLPFKYIASGTVAPGVARVRVTWTNGKTVQASVANGFFLAKLLVPAGGRDVPQQGFVVRAYGPTGALLSTLDRSEVPVPPPTGAAPQSSVQAPLPSR